VKAILNRGGSVMSIDAFQTDPRWRRATRATAHICISIRPTMPTGCRMLTAEYLRMRSRAQNVNLVGLETAGLWSFFARAMAGQGVNLVADLAQFAADTDAAYVDNLFIPGLRKAGDFRAAAVLNTQGRMLIYNAGPQFPAEWARQAAKAGASELDVRTTAAAAQDTLTWLVSASRRTSR
jgi:hypothetical protein